MFTYFSIFSGIGGFDVGIKAALPSAECVGYSEVDKYAISIYQRHFKGHINYGDATKINAKELPDFDCLVGGFPCQAFSIAGKRRGFSDTRGTLFFEIARIIREKQPRYLVLENVKGLLSHDQGNSANIIMSSLDELGYDCQWHIINSKNHGVPQNRERVFIIGCLRTNGKSIRQIFPITKNNQANNGTGYIRETPKLKQLISGSQGDRVYCSSGIATTQSSLGGGMGAKTGLYAIPVLTPDRVNKRQNGRRFKEVGDPSFTLTSQDRHGVFDGNNIRKLTPLECERLQGFNDNWTKYGDNGELISDSQRYKCCGNAVTVNAISYVFSLLIEQNQTINKSNQKKEWIPKVVKFSGGRTSGMLLLQLLKSGELQQWRGDCVIFCNTSAEHKATYSFVARMKHICENDYNIPFFIIEYQSYETKNSRGYLRRESYRIVNEYPFCPDQNPAGYKHKGEVFEELISHQGSLPSIYQRTCTISMKIITTNQFLSDWYAQKQSIEYLGHSGQSKRKNKDIIQTHKRHHGTLSDEIIINKKVFVQNCDCYRPSQKFRDFTKANTVYVNSNLLPHVHNGKAQLFKNQGLKFMSYLGIRHDEKFRADRIRKRAIQVKNEIKRNKYKTKKSYKFATQPTNEIIMLPLIKARINKQRVIDFWKNRSDDIVLPYSGLLSNCVFCPLKGKSNNQIIQKKYGANIIDNNTPQSLAWWSDIELMYSHKIKKTNKNNYTHIGFFGSKQTYTYQQWLNNLANEDIKQLVSNSSKDSWTMNCNCTD